MATNVNKPKRQFWSTKAGTPERENEIKLARLQGLELFELRSHTEAFCMTEQKNGDQQCCTISCEAKASQRSTWPGTVGQVFCDRCAARARATADAMGFLLAIEPLAEEPIPDVSFVCPECSGTVRIGGDATDTEHSFPLCSRWLKIETLADATQLLREATDKLAARHGRKG